MNFTLTDVIKACGGEVINGRPDLELTGISTDTRTIKKGDLFVAISGHYFDGHDYCDEAVSKGASALLVSNRDKKYDAGTVLVRDTIFSLGEMARWWRSRFDVPCVAITGSNGKSTTKEMTAAIAGSLGRILKTKGNFNNLIGLPLSIFDWQDADAVAILEMGMNAAGEIARLTQIASPSIGLITNVTAAHLEKLGDVEAVASAKGELFETMNGNGLAIINEEDPFVVKLSKSFKGQKITFGMQNNSDVRFLHMESQGLESMRLKFSVRGKNYSSNLKVVGVHNVMNALSSVAVGLALGVDPDESSKRLEDFVPMKMRFEQVQLKNGVRLVNDSYNANPASVRASLRTVGAAKRGGRFIAVLGDMLELGDDSQTLHYELGRDLFSFGVAKLFAVGKFAKFLADGAKEGGLKEALSFLDAGEILDLVEGSLKQGDIILIKGSRGMRMERLVDHLKERVGVY